MNINKKDTNEASANLSRTVRFKGHEQLPYRLILSLLSHKPIRIDDIRPDDQEPGLNEAEVSFLRLIEKLTNGTTVEISYTGTSLLFVPGTLTGGHITHQTPLSSSIGYFLTPILAIAPFCKHDLTLVLKGITTSNDSLSVDVLRVSGLPTLGIWLGENAGKLELKISKRGHPPEGGGECCFKCPSVKTIKPGVNFTESGRISKIRGIAHSVRVSPQLSNRLVASARSVLNRYIPDIYIYTDVYRGAESGKSPGYGLTLLGTSTTTALYTAEAVSYPASTPEDIGILASRRLLKQISRGGCIDQGFEWLGLLFLLLSHQTDIGRIKIGGPFTEALVAWIRDLKKVFGVQFKITTVERQPIPEALEDDDEDSEDEEAEGQDHNKAVIKQKTIDLLPCEYVVSAVGLGWINTAKSAK
ncbi:18S rRNA biogenesis protein RCL1 [Puccinia striiformis f. sp. tritici PST-78]|uniref:18S rRNA biogenesis protein RCL1 n=1 Tax=Puccinia striiformis f. sp. tritici PST-78 TaxID=1165861 RepID=A0A0L0VMF8_9BASI|nr:18S rRNA biogenesis protein RCL1 [Puccinia striiformis f. sp. tritici PST-78]